MKPLKPEKQSLKAFALTEKVFQEGCGLHSGAPSSLTFLPSSKKGVYFLKQGTLIPAALESVVDTCRGVSLTRNNLGVKTVEHLLAAVSWLGFSDLEIQVEGEEIPILDGSALPWIASLKPFRKPLAQDFPQRKLSRPVQIQSGGALIKASPDSTLQIRYTIDFPGTPVGKQTWEGEITPLVFEKELAPARTFGFMEEVDKLRESGLALGGNSENCVVVGKHEFLTPLRFPDEMIRHKVLDLLGDLALLGWIPRARIEVEKGGHELHLKLVRELQSCFSNFEERKVEK